MAKAGTFLNGAQLNNRRSVMWAIHRFLGTDEGVHIQHAARAEGQIHQHTALGNLAVIANALHGAKAIKLAVIRIEVQVL